MGVIQSIFYAAFLAMLVPVLIHFMFRMRTRRVDLGTLRFLQEVIQKNARRKRIKRWILLGSRLLAVAVLAALFCRPYIIGTGDSTSGGFVAILIDRSASMGFVDGDVSLFDQAKAEAKKILDRCDQETRIEIAFFDQGVTTIGADESLTEELQRAKLSPLGTNYNQALAWARDVCVRSDATMKQVHILTDLQRSGVEWSKLDSMPDDVDVRLHSIGSVVPKNVAVTSLNSPRSMIRPGETFNVQATTANFNSEKVSNVVVRLFLESDRLRHTETQTLAIDAKAVETAEFEIDELQPGLWRGYVEAEYSDDLRFDNRRYLAVNVAPSWRILIVDNDPQPTEELAESYFLATALRLAPSGKSYPDTPYETTVRAELPIADLSDFDAVILANPRPLTTAAADALGAYVHDGGGLLCFGGANVDDKVLANLEVAGLDTGEFQGVRIANDVPWHLDDWNNAHQIFEPFRDPQHGNLERLRFHGYTSVSANSDHVLARFDTGDPALLVGTHGKGKTLFFASSCSRVWSDWPRSRLYVPIVHQLVGHLTGLNEGGPVRQATLVHNGADKELEPGVHLEEKYCTVINVNPAESDLERCSSQEFEERYAISSSDSSVEAISNSASIVPVTKDLRDDEIWPWLVIGLIGLLCGEFLLANRTTT